MTSLAFRSPVTKPLLRAGTPKPVPPDPRAYDTFRVTQQFDSPDAFHRDGRKHNATDIGNFRCGDAVVAMRAGYARRVKDNATALGAKSDALGIVIDHGNGITTEYWHLDGYSIPFAAQQVATGQQIGVVGRTGLGDVCHLHVEAKRNGVRFDPEPLMFGGSVAVDGQQEDGMLYGADEVASIGDAPTFRLTTNAWARSEPRVATETAIEVIAAGKTVRGAHWVKGQKVGDSDQWLDTRVWAAGRNRPVVFHSSVLERLPVTGSIEAEEVERLTAKILRARTAMAGAINATDAALAAQNTAREALK